MAPSAVRSRRTSCGSTRRRATSRTSTTSQPATIRPTSRRSPARMTSAKQAYAGTYTYDNNGRVTWAISEKQKLSSWYAYQYKVDPHWLLNIFNASPEAARITTWHTQLSTTKWTYAATNKVLFEVGVMAGASPDTIDLNHDLVGQCPSQGSLAPVCISITEQTAGNFSIGRPPARITTTAAVAVVHGLDELRDRFSQREGRLRHAARPLLARGQQRFHRRHLVHHHGGCAGIRHYPGAGVRLAEQPQLQPRASTRRIDGR